MPRTIAIVDGPDPVDKFVGSRLRAERIRMGWSQADLGLAIGVTFQQVQKYERGVNRLSASMLVRSSKALGVPVAEFFPPDDQDVAASDRVELHALKGGSALAQAFAAMGPGERALLVQIARTFARQPD